MKLRKLVTKDWVHVSPRIVSRGGEKVWEAVEIGYIFGGIVIGRFKCGKMTIKRKNSL